MDRARSQAAAKLSSRAFAGRWRARPMRRPSMPADRDNRSSERMKLVALRRPAVGRWRCPGIGGERREVPRAQGGRGACHDQFEATPGNVGKDVSVLASHRVGTAFRALRRKPGPRAWRGGLRDGAQTRLPGNSFFGRNRTVPPSPRNRPRRKLAARFNSDLRRCSSNACCSNSPPRSTQNRKRCADQRLGLGMVRPWRRSIPRYRTASPGCIATAVKGSLPKSSTHGPSRSTRSASLRAWQINRISEREGPLARTKGGPKERKYRPLIDTKIA